MFFWGYGVFLRKFFLGILEFPALLRGSKSTEAISRNSRIYLGILEFI